MLNTLNITQRWLTELIPEDIEIPSTTVITGPAGAAKEILGSMFAASWIKQGGSLIHILTNFKRMHAEKLLKDFDVNLAEYKGKIVFIDFDPKIKDINYTSHDELRVNLLNSHLFNSAILKASDMLSVLDSKVMTYMTALNMLLYSKSFSKNIFKFYLSRVNDKYINIFTYSDNIFTDMMNKIKNKADNVLYMHATGIMNLSLNVLKVNNKLISSNEIITPFSESQINEHLLELQNYRQGLVPIIKKI